MEFVKYPCTFHLLWSPGASSDDKILSSIDHFFDPYLYDRNLGQGAAEKVVLELFTKL